MNIFFPSTISLLVLLLFFPAAIQAKEIPVEVGGFVLGSNVTDYPDIEYSNFLKEVVIYDWHGFDKGIISYGICDSPGEIVKIKLKYEDSSKKFFKTLLKKYKAVVPDNLSSFCLFVNTPDLKGEEITLEDGSHRFATCFMP